MDDPPMKEYQDYAPQDQQQMNGYTTERLQTSESIPMKTTRFEEQPQQQPHGYVEQNSNPFKNQPQNNPFRK